MKALARRFPFLFYYALALLIAAAVMVVYATMLGRDPKAASILPAMFDWLGGHHLHTNALNIVRYATASGRWSVLLILVFAVAPTVSAFVTVALRLGGQGVVRWLVRLKPWGANVAPVQAGRVYAALALIYFGGLAWFLFLTWAWGTPADFTSVWTTLGGSLPLVAIVSCVSAFLDEGGMLEEMGWRGYALPLLQQRMSPLLSAILLGLAWDAWHLPREVPTLLGGLPVLTWLGRQAVFALLTVSLSIVIAYFVNRTGGSVLPAIILHGGTNVWSKAAGAPAYAMFHTDMRTWIVGALAVVIVAIGGRALGQPSSAMRARGTTPPKTGDAVV